MTTARGSAQAWAFSKIGFISTACSAGSLDSNTKFLWRSERGENRFAWTEIASYLDVSSKPEISAMRTRSDRLLASIFVITFAR